MKELQKISKNCLKGKPILTANYLAFLSRNRQSVYHPNWGIKPAAVITRMQFSAVMNAIDTEKLFKVINTKPKEQKKVI